MRSMPVLMLLLLSLAACAGGGEPGCRLEKVAELPVRVEQNVPVVTVEINGKPARFVIDTGSDATVLSRGAAARLGVVAGGQSRLVGAAGGRASVAVGRVAAFGIGGDVVRDVRVLIAERPAAPLDGLLGIDVLVGYELDLDIPRGRAGLYRARSCAVALPDFGGSVGGGGRIVRLPTTQQAGSGHMFVSLTVDGEPLRGMLDSGASGSTLSLQAAEDIGLRRGRLAALPQARGQSLNREGLTLRQATFQTLKVGGDVLERPRLTIADLPPFTGDVLVGEDYIGTRRMWFSFRLGRVYVEGR